MDDDVFRRILASRVMDRQDESTGLSVRNILEHHAVQEFKRIADRNDIDFVSAKCQAVQVCGGFTVVHMYITFEEGTALPVYGTSKLMTYNGKGQEPDRPNLKTGVSVAISRLVNMLSGKEASYVDQACDLVPT